FEARERKMLETCAAVMTRHRRRHDVHRFSCVSETAAVVDIFEPRRRESLVVRADLVEDFAANEQRRASRLLDALRLREIEIAITIVRRCAIARQQSSEREDLR